MFSNFRDFAKSTRSCRLRRQPRARWQPFAGIVLAIASVVFPPCACAAELTQVQAYPSRPIRIIVGQQPGVPSDTLARLVAEKLAASWKESVVVENHPGASGMIAAEAVAKAPADGYTLLMASHSNLVLAKAAGTNLRYDPLSDFAPIGRVAYVPFVLAVYRDVPAKTIPELVAYAATHPGQLTYATAGSGTMSQLGIELLKAAAAIDLLAVHYKGAGSALHDVIAGRVDMMLVDHAVVAPHVTAGAVRILGSSGAHRASAALDVPTFAEQGIAGFAVDTWYGLVAPAKTPADVLARLSGALADIRTLPDVRARLGQLGYDPIDDSPGEFRIVIGSEIDKYSAIVKRASVKH